MPDSVLMALGALELVGLVGLFALTRRAARRREAGMPRAPRWLRILTALLGLFVLVAFPALVILTVVNSSLQAERLRDELVQTGTPATATITHVEETGTVINHQPEVRVSLTVQPPGAPPFAAESTWVFSVQDIQTYRVGSKVKVYFDPSDHQRVAVVGVAPDAK